MLVFCIRPKKARISIAAAIAVLGMFSAASAGDFDEAFKNGKVSGDVIVT